MTEKTLNTILKGNIPLSNIISKAKLITKIEKLVRAELSLLLSPTATMADEHLTLLRAIHVANYHHGRLSLITENAAIATRLRFLIPELTEKLRSSNQLPGLANIVFNTGHVVEIKAPESLKQISKISPASSALLKETLEQLRSK